MTKPYEYLTDGFRFLHDEAFIDFLEMHLELMRMRSINDGYTRELSAHDRSRCDRDFGRVCSILDIPFSLHGYAMRLNNFTSPTEYRQSQSTIILPHVDELLKLKTVFDEYHKIT